MWSWMDLTSARAPFTSGWRGMRGAAASHSLHRPVWDGNEVWLLAAGGTLYFAFPALYASSFSGFYLPLMIVLWLLILRGIAVEFRGHLTSPIWLKFWDVVFSGASLLLAVFFGAALGNVVRGVPLNDQGYFFEAFGPTSAWVLTPACWTGIRLLWEWQLLPPWSCTARCGWR